jgi:hypothetical protein
LEEGEEEELTEEDLTEDLEDIYNNLDEPRWVNEISGEILLHFTLLHGTIHSFSNCV